MTTSSSFIDRTVNCSVRVTPSHLDTGVMRDQNQKRRKRSNNLKQWNGINILDLSVLHATENELVTS